MWCLTLQLWKRTQSIEISCPKPQEIGGRAREKSGNCIQWRCSVGGCSLKTEHLGFRYPCSLFSKYMALWMPSWYSVDRSVSVIWVCSKVVLESPLLPCSSLDDWIINTDNTNSYPSPPPQILQILHLALRTPRVYQQLIMSLTKKCHCEIFGKIQKILSHVEGG